MGLFLLFGCQRVDHEWVEDELPRFLFEMTESRLKLPMQDVTINEMEYVYTEVKIEAKDKRTSTINIAHVFVSYTFENEALSFFGSLQKGSFYAGTEIDYHLIGYDRELFDEVLLSVQKEEIEKNEKELQFKLISYKKEEHILSEDAIKDFYEEAVQISGIHGFPSLKDVDFSMIGGNGVTLSMNREDYKQHITKFEMNPVLKNTHGNTFKFEKVTSKEGRVFYTYDDNQMIQTEEGYLSFRLYIKSQDQYVSIFGLQFSSITQPAFDIDVAFQDHYNREVDIDGYFTYNLESLLRASISSPYIKPYDTYVMSQNNYMSHLNYDEPIDFRELGGMPSYVYAKTGSYPQGSDQVTLPKPHQMYESLQLILSEKDDYYEGYIDMCIWFELWDLSAYPFIDTFSFSFHMYIE